MYSFSYKHLCQSLTLTHSPHAGGDVANGILPDVASGMDVMETEIVHLQNSHTHVPHPPCTGTCVNTRTMYMYMYVYCKSCTCSTIGVSSDKGHSK